MPGLLFCLLGSEPGTFWSLRWGGVTLGHSPHPHPPSCSSVEGAGLFYLFPIGNLCAVTQSWCGP